MADDNKLYNVYSWKEGEEAELEASGLYLHDAQKLAAEVLERGPLWDSYIVPADEDAGSFMKA